MSNRFQLGERESVYSTIEGTDFGGKVWMLARSPEAVLLWVTGHSWSNNGNKRYAPPLMVLMPRDQSRRGWLQYTRIAEGKRLSLKLLEDVWPKLESTFGTDAKEWLRLSLKSPRRTLIVEGGGRQLMPHRSDGEAAYLAWRDLPEESRGLKR